ncbi:MAG: hypothetical protein JXR12_05215 [Neptunomonas phycophila]|uniref:hypothetical protein n=1 Tax=Neptunomonas phycophila TaxID=1572645 RepID=UPI003B8D7EE2
MTKPYFPTNSWIKPNADGVSNLDMVAKAMSDFEIYVGTWTVDDKQKEAALNSVLSLAEFINYNARKYRFCVVGGKYHTIYTEVQTEADGTPLRKRTVLALDQEIRRGRYACNWTICQGDAGKTDKDNRHKTISRRKAYSKAGIAPNGAPMLEARTYAPKIVSRAEKVNESPTRSSTGRKNKNPMEIAKNSFRRISSLSDEYCATETHCTVRGGLLKTQQLEFNFKDATPVDKIRQDIKNRYK